MRGSIARIQNGYMKDRSLKVVYPVRERSGLNIAPARTPARHSERPRKTPAGTYLVVTARDDEKERNNGCSGGGGGCAAARERGRKGRGTRGSICYRPFSLPKRQQQQRHRRVCRCYKRRPFRKSHCLLPQRHQASVSDELLVTQPITGAKPSTQRGLPNSGTVAASLQPPTRAHGRSLSHCVLRFSSLCCCGVPRIARPAEGRGAAYSSIYDINQGRRAPA